MTRYSIEEHKAEDVNPKADIFLASEVDRFINYIGDELSNITSMMNIHNITEINKLEQAYNKLEELLDEVE